MILIADSGSTKTDWVLLERNGQAHTFQSNGLNPYTHSEDAIAEELCNTLKPRLAGVRVSKIYFYGAGCTPAKANLMEGLLRQAVGHDCNIEVQSDMLGACRSLCGNEPGIVCILGTGSNSCYYDGQRMAQNVPSLGYVLGDEGSGNMLGRILLSDLLKGLLPKELEESFNETYHLEASDVIEAVYRQPNPNRYLAQFSTFVHRHLNHPAMQRLARECFERFISRNLWQYEGYQHLLTHFIGSVAWAYSDILTATGTAMGIKTGRIKKSPIDGLTKFHAENG